MGEVEYAPGEPKGTPWHPHRGFETVTYMIDGEMAHRDSHGGGGLITNGDTQWMTAGSGILHIETPPEELVVKGGLFHGFQLWVNLPASKKFSPPAYQELRGDKVTLLASPDGGTLIRLIAGDLGGHAGPGTPGPYRPDSRHPRSRLEAQDPVASRFQRPRLRAQRARHRGRRGTADPQRAAGSFRAGQRSDHGGRLHSGVSQPQHGHTHNGGKADRRASGWNGPFVMNTHSELAQAFEDYQRGRLGSIPAGH
ncbi:pirin family protein [soil metagenome]